MMTFSGYRKARRRGQHWQKCSSLACCKLEKEEDTTSDFPDHIRWLGLPDVPSHPPPRWWRAQTRPPPRRTSLGQGHQLFHRGLLHRPPGSPSSPSVRVWFPGIPSLLTLCRTSYSDDTLWTERFLVCDTPCPPRWLGFSGSHRMAWTSR